jgi:hypothetical protein
MLILDEIERASFDRLAVDSIAIVVRDAAFTQNYGFHDACDSAIESMRSTINGQAS